MSKIDHNPEFKPDDAKKDWGIDVGNNTSSNNAKLVDAEQNPETVDNGESLADRESSSASGSNILNSNQDAGWTNSVTGDTSRKGKFIGFIKRHMPAAAVGTLVTSGGIVGVVFFSQAAIAFHFIESLTNFSDDSTSSLHIRTKVMLKNKIKNDFTESSDGKCNLMCKFGSVNENFINKLKAKGFTVDSTKKSFGRYTINSLTFPDGTKVNNGAEFDKALKDIPRLSSLNSAFNFKSSFFLNKYFSIDTLNKKFNIDKKAKLKTPADTADGKDVDRKKSVIQSLRESLGLPKSGTTKVTDTALYKDITAKIEKLKLNKAVNYANIPAIMCSVYDISKGITFAVKTAKIASLAAITMIFFNAIDETKAGDSDENIMSVIGDMLTKTDANGDTVTSSPGFRAATYNEPMVISKEDEKYSITTSSAVNAAIGVVTSIVSVGGIIGIVNMSKMCFAATAVTNPIIDLALSCPAEIASALLLALETVGIAAIWMAIKCGIKAVGIPAAVSLAVGVLLKSILGIIYNHELFTIDDTTKGASLGNALFSGGAQILGGKSATYGLRPAKHKSEIGSYMQNTADARQQQLAINSYDAKDTPFDVNNQYSFTGSIVKKLGLASLYNTSAVNNISNLFNFLPRSFASLSNNVYAEGNTKADLFDNKCSDLAMKNIEIEAADALCNPSYVMEKQALDINPNGNIEWMLFTESIDFDGNILPKSHYAKYSKYCVNRTEPLGETMIPLSDPDYAWAVGLMCTRDSIPIEDPEFAKKMAAMFGEDDIKLYHFRAYTMDLAINNTIDEPYASSGASGGAPADATIDVANLYNDSTSVGCAAGTTDAGVADGYTDGNLVKINLCKIPGTLDNDENLDSPREATVNSRVSGAWLALINEMKTATGESTIGVASSFRTMAMQEADKAKYGGGAATPGFSNHQMGLAIDFDTLYGAGSWGKGEKPYYDFLSHNGGGAKYGFEQISSEAWHWEPIH